MGCRRSLGKGQLLRLVAAGDVVECDPQGRRLGRGAYLCARPDCLDKALRRGAFRRALRAPVTITEESLDCISRWQRSVYTR